VRRFFFMLVALSVLAHSAQADAEKKKGKRHHGHKAAAAKADAGAAASNGGPFSDVPRGHWAYEAVQKAAEAGILQGWNGRFHGNKVVNRYQMAVVVARMLDRVGVLKANGKVITGQDIANLESLVIEFADELALLNVKVSTLEDTVAGLKRDVDLIKSDMRGVGARAGISGVVETRFVHTDDVGNAYRFGSSTGLPLGTVSPFTPVPATTTFPGAAASTGLTRYHGAQTFPTAGTTTVGATAVGSVAVPAQFDNRDFFSVSNFSLNIDREFDPHTHFHAQIGINAEGSSDSSIIGGGITGASVTGAGGLPTEAAGGAGAPLAGRGNSFSFGTGDIVVDEAYVTWADWFTDGVTGRLGVFALPMNTEVNGPSRTYQWTITPSVVNSKWESIRPVGLDLFQHNEKDSLMFYVGFFTPGDTASGEYRSGALLSQSTGFGTFAQTDAFFFPGVTTATGGVNTFSALPGGVAGATATFGAGAVGAAGIDAGRFPTPFSGPAMTDQARGIAGQTLSSNDIGYYAMIGSHPTNRGHRGLSWHVAYFDRNGSLKPGTNELASATDWYAWQLGASYQWPHVALATQYYEGTSRNYTTGDLGIGAAAASPRANTTPFANAAGFDTDSKGFFALLNWQFNRRGSLTTRYETASDTTGLASMKADIWTLGFNWRTSDHSWLQLEWITPSTRSQSENGVANTTDNGDDLLQVNYKYNW
jgi:hypothetical protein